MTYDQLTETLFQIPSGYGDGGENFGAYLVVDKPSVVIGASGSSFVNNLEKTLKELKIQEFNLLLPNVTIHELIALKDFNKKFKNTKIMVHKSISQIVQNPQSLYFDKRFQNPPEHFLRELTKQIPKKIENVVSIDRSTNIQLETTKILVIPFPGPHSGHTFLYSTDHRALFSGILVGVTPLDPNFYYLDLTSSLDQYLLGLEFIQQATAEIHALAYDRRQFLRNQHILTAYLKSSISGDLERITETCKTAKSFEEILQEFKHYKSDSLFYPYSKLNFVATSLQCLLNYLVSKGTLIEKGSKYVVQ